MHHTYSLTCMQQTQIDKYMYTPYKHTCMYHIHHIQPKETCVCITYTIQQINTHVYVPHTYAINTNRQIHVHTIQTHTNLTFSLDQCLLKL